MIADVLVTRRQLTDQIVLPQTAILMDENGSSVYVVDRSGGETGTELRPIELGPSYGGFTVIFHGARCRPRGDYDRPDHGLLRVICLRSHPTTLSRPSRTLFQ